MLQIRITVGSIRERGSGAHQLGHAISIVTKMFGWQAELEEASRNFCSFVFRFALTYRFPSKYEW